MTGMFAVELFETTDERLLVNELAMRPHNSGHWTQDGAVTSQFEQHLRAVLDLPLGSADPVAEATCMINILGGPAGIDIDERFARRDARAAGGEDPHLRKVGAPGPQGRTHQRRGRQHRRRRLRRPRRSRPTSNDEAVATVRRSQTRSHTLVWCFTSSGSRSSAS